ncbi:GDSL-type esterase/lipase family protein [Thermodesulfobacteriota bacterium]
MKKADPFLFVFALIAFFPPSAASADTVTGVIYHDWNQSSLSEYAQTINPLDAPLPDVDVHLIDRDSERHLLTAADGSFRFGNLAPGHYLLDVGLAGDHECTSNNQGRRTPQAIREGALNILTVGDSIGVQGHEIPYPERLADHFSQIVETTLNNQAAGGARTWDWLPGADKHYYENRLVPNLPEADLVTITLLGNDADIYVEGMEPPYDIPQVIRNFLEAPEYIFNAIPNVVELLGLIRELNPDCDIVYAVYPNFGNSSYMEAHTGEQLQPFVSSLMKGAMSLLRWRIGIIERIGIADMLGAHGDEWLDPYLIDEVHPSGEGHQSYADQMFRALGGVVIEPGVSSDDERMVGFYAPDLVAADAPVVDAGVVRPESRAILRTRPTLRTKAAAQ